MLNRSSPPRSHVTTQLARQATQAIVTWQEADFHGHFHTNATDRLYALAAEASFHPCGGAAGALYHVSVLNGLLADEEGEGARMARRLIDHLASYIEETGGVSREEAKFAGWYFANEIS